MANFNKNEDLDLPLNRGAAEISLYLCTEETDNHLALRKQFSRPM